MTDKERKNTKKGLFAFIKDYWYVLVLVVVLALLSVTVLGKLQKIEELATRLAEATATFEQLSKTPVAAEPEPVIVVEEPEKILPAEKEMQVIPVEVVEPEPIVIEKPIIIEEPAPVVAEPEPVVIEQPAVAEPLPIVPVTEAVLPIVEEKDVEKFPFVFTPAPKDSKEQGSFVKPGTYIPVVSDLEEDPFDLDFAVIKGRNYQTIVEVQAVLEDLRSDWGLPKSWGRSFGVQAKAGVLMWQKLEAYGVFKFTRSVPFRNDNIFNEVPKSYIFQLGAGAGYAFNRRFSLTADFDLSFTNFSIENVDVYSLVGFTISPTYRLPLFRIFDASVSLPISYQKCKAGYTFSFGVAIGLEMGNREE